MCKHSFSHHTDSGSTRIGTMLNFNVYAENKTQALTVVLSNTAIRGDGSRRTEPSFPEEATKVTALQRICEGGLAGPGVTEEFDLHAV